MKGLQLKTTALLVSFLWLLVFEKLVNNRIVDHLEKCCLFSDFQYGCRSSPSTADLLTVYLMELLGLLTGLGLPELWHLIYARLLTGFGIPVFCTNVSHDIWPYFFFSL